MRRQNKALLIIGTAVAGAIVILLITASVMAHRIDPYIRAQAMEYLRARFESEVELKSLRVRIPNISPLRLLLTRGRGALANVTGEGLILRHKGRRDLPAMFAIRNFSFEVDLGTLFKVPKVVPYLSIEDMEIHIPPKGERPQGPIPVLNGPSVVINVVEIKRGGLVIIPKDPKKIPLQFTLHHVRLESAGATEAMTYYARLTNPRPPGEIRSQGNFGPWNSAEPGDTPLSGNYLFENADLSVFPAIAGVLKSTGAFEGALDYVNVKGKASVPDFRLKRSGSRVPLETQFDVIVDGTNGNTTLNPVIARLGGTNLKTSGTVIKHEGDTRRTISLDVSMPQGDLRDVLRLGMKGSPLMEGDLSLKTRIEIPPLDQKVRERLVVDGRFQVSRGKFLRPNIQDKIDTLSRRGQGQPENEAIEQVFSRMRGSFRLDDQVITFRKLTFAVPGAEVDLRGKYDLAQDALDLHGHLKLTAKVSETMTGVKRWLLKPVDPFLAKAGAGTYLAIKVEGSSKDPKFGHD